MSFSSPPGELSALSPQSSFLTLHSSLPLRLRNAKEEDSRRYQPVRDSPETIEIGEDGYTRHSESLVARGV